MFLSIDPDRRTVRTSSTSGGFSDMEVWKQNRLREEIEMEKLKGELENAKSRRSGSGSVSAASDDAAAKLAADRAYESGEADRAFQRQRTLNQDREAAESRLAADNTANQIKLRREASARGASMQRALSRSRR